jgi:hypothetical protein
MGLVAVLFVLVLSVTGVALNHSSDWQLDRRYIDWPWLSTTLGVSVPEPAASFADRGHRVTLLGRRAYFDSTDIPRELDSLNGLVTLDQFAVVATRAAVLLLTLEGELVEYIDLTSDLPGTIERLGLVNERPVLEAAGVYFIGDADVTGFEQWSQQDPGDVAWSTASDPTPAEFAVIADRYRGRGLTIERLLIEIHSGRIVGAAGPLLLDVVAAVLIVLSISGLVIWLRGPARGSGTQGGRRTR